jgi:hypothetical protein
MLILVPTFPFNTEKMKANRLLLVCIGILILINVFLLLECNKPGHDGRPPKLSIALEMKGADAAWVDHEFQRHIHEKSRLLNQQKSWRMKLLLDQSKIEQNQRIFEKISRLQFQIDSCTFDHFMRVKTKCSKKQKIKLTKLVRRMIQRAGKPGPKGRP